MTPLLKGSLLVTSLPTIIAQTITFQYNPEKVTHNLSANISDEKGTALGKNFKAMAKETISMDVKLQCIDEMTEGVAPTGLLPTLNTFEMLVNPSMALVLASQALYLAGTMAISPLICPNVTLNLGSRAFPVQVDSVNITETAYDHALNPIEAEVSLTMSVLTINDVTLISAPAIQYNVYAAMREAQALSGFYGSPLKDRTIE